MTKVKICDLKSQTGVGFGTSGIRDLATNLTDYVVYAYTMAFIKYLQTIKQISNSIAIAGDLRESTDRIILAVCRACLDNKIEVINCGKIPSPAVAYFGAINKIPSIMVTGSHIPGDRNGVKFNLADREILKSDELMITNMEIEFDENLVSREIGLPVIDDKAKDIYVDRYINFFKNTPLLNNKIGVYGHSAVGRDIIVEILTKLGAEVIKIGYSDTFVPIDTEVISDELLSNLKKWHAEYGVKYIVSTDGDSDRPLITDEEGNYLLSDIVPIIAAKYLGIKVLATPISCSTAVDKCGFFDKIIKTKIGSPYVVQAMIDLENEGNKIVASYERNGGFLLGTDLDNLTRLPTRDAILVILSVLIEGISTKVKLKELFNNLSKRTTYSSSIKGIPTEKSLSILENWEKYKNEIENNFGKIVDINLLDGLRLTFDNGDIVHFRPSKNAPEFRDYTESDSLEKAKKISDIALGLITQWTKE